MPQWWYWSSFCINGQVRSKAAWSSSLFVHLCCHTSTIQRMSSVPPHSSIVRAWLLHPISMLFSRLFFCLWWWPRLQIYPSYDGIIISPMVAEKMVAEGDNVWQVTWYPMSTLAFSHVFFNDSKPFLVLFVTREQCTQQKLQGAWWKPFFPCSLTSKKSSPPTWWLETIPLRRCIVFFFFLTEYVGALFIPLVVTWIVELLDFSFLDQYEIELV